MKFKIKFETTYKGYLITRLEYSDTKSGNLLYVDELACIKDRVLADNYYTDVINKISKELFRIVESSAVCVKSGNKPTYAHAVFESNNLLDVSRYYADRN